MASIKGGISGIKSVGIAISNNKKRSSNIKNQRGLFTASTLAIEAWVKRNFRADGRNHDESRYYWPPLKASTIAARRKGRGVGTPKILRDTGNLQNRWSRIITNKQGILKSQQNYSGIHEGGTSRIPQRKIFPTEKQGRSIVRPVFETWIRKNITDV